MAGSAVKHSRVDAGMRAPRKTVEEVVHQLGLQVAHQARANFRVNDGRRASTKIHRGEAQRLIHRQQEITGSQNAALAAEGFFESLTEHNADVFYGVMLIDIQ